MQYECFACAKQYAFVCKMYVCMYYATCFGVKMNVCMYYAICFGVKMNVCMYHVGCFGVHNECLHVLCLFPVLA